jgi:hypothetical protein
MHQRVHRIQNGQLINPLTMLTAITPILATYRES